jgi:hypothetical protein
MPLIPTPRDMGIISVPVPKKLLMRASIYCYTSARGCTATLGNFAKTTSDAISKTYNYLISLSGIHQSPCKKPHQNLHAEDLGSSCGCNTWFLYKKNKSELSQKKERRWRSHMSQF